MNRRLGIRLGCCAALIALHGLAPAAQAQLRVESQVALASRQLWRGISRSSRPSLQSSAAVGWRNRSVGLATGAWSNVELGNGESSDRTIYGLGRAGLGELDWWASASVYDGHTAITAGVLRYTYHGRPARGGLDHGSNTTELWGTLDLRGELLSPRLDVFWDIERIDGFYLAGSSAVPVLAWPFSPFSMVYLEGELGLNLGQRVHPGRPGSGYFDDTGVTHARVSLQVPLFHAGGFAGRLAYGAQLGFDPATRAGLDGDPTRGRLTHLVEARVTFLHGGGDR